MPPRPADSREPAGFWRMLEVLDRRRIRCTAVVNAEALRRFPEIRDAAVERDWRYVGHGMSNSRFTYGFDDDAERAYYAEMATLSRHSRACA